MATNLRLVASRTTASDLRVSEVVTALEAVWADLRAVHPELPLVAITVATGVEATNIRRAGHWAAGRWVTVAGERAGEVFIAAELFGKGAMEVLGTLVHEAAHALAFARGIKDTSRQGRYHNERYKLLAEELGLHVAKDPTYGWTITRIADHAVDAYEGALTLIERQLVAAGGYRTDALAATGTDADDASGTDADDASEGPSKPAGRALATCGCAEPRKIRVSPAVLALGPITCGCCGEEFAVR